MSQVQCPNCGGYRASTATTSVDTKSGAPLLSCGAYAFLIIVILALFLVGIYGGLGGSDPISICGLPAGVFLTVVLIRYSIKTRKVQKTTRFSHKCDLCGYEWHRLEGEPLPPVRVNPSLIAQGEERLRKEDQATREAAHWNYWHNPDNPWNNPNNTSTK